MDLVSTLSSEINQSGKVDLLVNLLSMFSTVLLGIFGVLSVILGFLVWKQKDLLSKAERDIEKIDELKKEVERAWKIVEELASAAKQNQADLQEIYTSLKSRVNQANDLVAEATKQVSEKTSKANEVMDKAAENLTDLLKEIERGRNSLATVAPPSLRNYSNQAIKNAQELLRSERMDSIKSRLDDYLKP